MSDTTFKVYFNGEVRRFQLPVNISFYDFLLTLEREIFNGNPDYHRELYLQYQDQEGDRITITSAAEWEEALRILSTENLKKFHIVEGAGVYFKDSPPPVPLFFHVKNHRFSGVYDLKVLYPGESSWGPFSDLIITPDGFVRLGTISIKGCVIDQDLNSLRWTKDSENESSAEIVFNFEGEHPSFDGVLESHSESMTVHGEWKQAAELKEKHDAATLNSIAKSVPEFLGKLFPGGKILPFLIPPWLSEAIKVHRVTLPDGSVSNDVDLDIDLVALGTALNSEAIKYIPDNLDLAEEYLQYYLQIDPKAVYAYYNLGCVAARKSDPDLAFFYLEQAKQYGYVNWAHYVEDEDLLSLHEDPRFLQLPEFSD